MEARDRFLRCEYTDLFSGQKDDRVLTFGHLKPSLCIVLLLSSLANLVALTVLVSRLRIA